MDSSAPELFDRLADRFDQVLFRREAPAELTRMHEAGGIVVDRGAVAWTAERPSAPLTTR